MRSSSGRSAPSLGPVCPLSSAARRHACWGAQRGFGARAARRQDHVQRNDATWPHMVRRSGTGDAGCTRRCLAKTRVSSRTLSPWTLGVHHIGRCPSPCAHCPLHMQSCAHSLVVRLCCSSSSCVCVCVCARAHVRGTQTLSLPPHFTFSETGNLEKDWASVKDWDGQRLAGN